MMKYLYLHCGHGRTGSTTLQKLLKKKHQNMAQENVFYPSDNGFTPKIIETEITSYLKNLTLALWKEGRQYFSARINVERIC